MTTLFNAVNSTATTTNGMATNYSSLNSVLDLFYMIGSSRGKDISATFTAAWAEDAELTARVLLWARDVRGGAGERDTVIKLLEQVAFYDADLAGRVVAKLPEVGRWSDVLPFIGTNLNDQVLNMIEQALRDANGLCAKWMPRPAGSQVNKARANAIRKHMKLTPKAYRKMLSQLSSTVEQQMCAGQWDDIEFDKLPSVAAARYQGAFNKHAQAAYAAYKEALNKGEAKINAGALYPYDVVKSLRSGDFTVANAQWAALPNYLEGSTENILPIVDVSGSMRAMVADNPNLNCMDVAISLGLYLSERTGGAFKNQFMTFSTVPTFQKVKGTLQQRYDQMKSADWGMSTNLEVVFKTLLDAAVKHMVPESEMPTSLLICSDMEFNSATVDRHYKGGWGGRQPAVPENTPAMEMIHQMYEDAGYKIPNIVFWNLRARAGNVPATADQEGVALVSGFSPSIMSGILGGDTFNPISIMMKTIMDERYEC